MNNRQNLGKNIKKYKKSKTQFSSNKSFNSEDDEIDTEYFSIIPIPSPKELIKYENIFNKDEPLLKDLECPICLNIIWDPFECCDCGKIFCYLCIKKSKEKNNSCPTCRKSPFQGRNAKSVKTFFNKISFNCIYKGCQEHPEYSEYLDHLKKCKYRLYKCNNEGCNYQDILEKMEIHATECKYLIIKCKYCSKDINLANLELHEKNECSEIIFCPKCHLKMAKKYYLNTHRKNEIDSMECQKEQIQIFQRDIKELLNNNERLKNELLKKDSFINKQKKDYNLKISEFIKKEKEYNLKISELNKNLKNEIEENKKLSSQIKSFKQEKENKQKGQIICKSLYIVFSLLCFTSIIVYYLFSKYKLDSK